MMAELLTYDEVDQILRGDGAGEFVGMSAIDGLIAAVVAGPAYVERDDWLRPIIGDRALVAAPEPPTHRLVRSILHRHEEVGDILMRRPESYLPMFMRHEDRILAEDWTIGFMLGVGLRAKAWEKIMGSPFRSTLSPILSVHEVGRNMMPDLSPTQLDRIKATAPQMIANVVPALYRHCDLYRAASRRLAKSRANHRR
jgi:yecA family protein